MHRVRGDFFGRDAGWRSSGGIRQGEWPVLARGVASDLVEYQDISNSTLRGRFHAAGRSLGARPQTLAARPEVR